MGHLIKEIDGLYDTYLGRFKVFRQFLTTLRNICYEIKSLDEYQDEMEEKMWKAISDLRTENEELREQLTQKLSAPKDTEGFMTAGKLMDKFHASQQVNN